ncbi:MAG: T9SS type A sorting domain-containing protein [Ignavibacteriaceae bacterium]|nr:T9SS type A sorting domain-containing protein [Ignavibacteriaceae bacterium]
MIRNIFVSLFLAGTLYSQSLTLVQHQYSITDTLGTEIIFYFSVINSGTAPLNFYVKRTANNIPEEWQSSLCFSSCFAPFMDSIVNNATFGSEPLAPGDTAEVSIHVFTMVAGGQATVSLRFGNVDNPLDTVSGTVYAATLPTGLINEGNADNFMLISNYPNPFNPETTVSFYQKESGFVDMKIISATGATISIFTNQYYNEGTHQVKIDFSRLGLTSGIYFLRLTSGLLTGIRKAVFLK